MAKRFIPIEVPGDVDHGIPPFLQRVIDTPAPGSSNEQRRPLSDWAMSEIRLASAATTLSRP